jgi:peptide deformylase
MAASPGCVGIAAPQVGILKRVIVVDASRSKKPCQAHGHMVLINPVISDPQGAELGREGCLSLPDFTANVMRAQSIKVEAQNLHGDNLSFTTTGFEARIILHEADHLDGLLFLDRVSSLKTDVFRRKRY